MGFILSDASSSLLHFHILYANTFALYSSHSMALTDTVYHLTNSD